MFDLAKAIDVIKTNIFAAGTTSDVALAAKLLEDIATADVVGEEACTSTGGPKPVVTQGGVHRYDEATGTWQEICTDHLMAMIQSYDGLVVKAVDSEGRESTKHLQLSAAKVRGIYACSMHSPQYLDADFFAKQARGIAFRNGFAVVSADGIDLRPKSPDHRAVAGVAYDFDPAAECPEWTAVVRRVFEGESDADDKRRLLQEYVGACVTGIAVDYSKCLIMTGGGNNGKNVVTDIVSEELMPPGTVTYTTPQSWARPEFLSRLRNAKLNVANETPATDIQAGDVFKAVIDGGRVTAKDLYKNPYEFRPRVAHIFLANELPGTKDNTHGFWRRLLVLEFKRNFSTRPDETGRLRTKEEIKAALVKELPGIMLWALNGAVRLLRRGGYTIPESHSRALNEWRLDSDQVAAFVDECCMLDGSATYLSEIHRSFGEWCNSTGRTALSNRSLAKRLRALGIESDTDRDGLFFRANVMVKSSWGVGKTHAK